jgi:hypothetical protein
MASYAFIQKESNVETKRLCATDTSTLRLRSGAIKAPAAIVVGDYIMASGYVLRVDEVVTAS